MNKTLKTYPDGSKITTKSAIFAVALCTATAAIGGVIALKLDERASRKAMKEMGIDPDGT